MTTKRGFDRYERNWNALYKQGYIVERRELPRGWMWVLTTRQGAVVCTLAPGDLHGADACEIAKGYVSVAKTG